MMEKSELVVCPIDGPAVCHVYGAREVQTLVAQLYPALVICGGVGHLHLGASQLLIYRGRSHHSLQVRRPLTGV
jgi:hypothetical protein